MEVETNVKTKIKTEKVMMTANWKLYEKRQARKHRGKHVGGSGSPDYVRGGVLGEVKCWQKPLTRNQVRQIAKKGIPEIVSKSGYTESAIRYVKRYRPYMKLFHRKRRKN